MNREVGQIHRKANCVDDAQVLSPEAAALIGRVRDELSEQVRDAAQSDGIHVADGAVTTCLDWARAICPHFAMVENLKIGVFVEGNGAISLVAQSMTSDRRLTCRVSPTGENVRAIRIDEHLQASSSEVNLNDPNAPRELAQWLIERN